MNPATALATVLVDELVRCGVQEAVLSPGSRSAPLALALHTHPGIRLHVRIDERSAGFLAVGLAKASGRPVPVVCTSGTATVNLHPAVLEADQSGTPLLLLTADRPPELRGTGANQTSDQVKVYGQAVRGYLDVGVPEKRAGMVAYWRSLTCRAVGLASDGPVHLNIPLREPLIPSTGSDWPEKLDGRADGTPWVRFETRATSPTDSPHQHDPRAQEFDIPERGIVIVGTNVEDPARAVAFAEAAGWPILAESTSNARYGPNAISTYGLLLKLPHLVEQLRPEMVVSFGRITVATELLQVCRRADTHIAVASERNWTDPLHTVDKVIDALFIPEGKRSTAWLSRWLDAEKQARAALDAFTDTSPTLTERKVTQEVADLVPDDSLVFVGASMPVRNLDLVMRPRTGVRVMANRGVSGIDGTVSTAVGAALAHQRAGHGPAYLLLGDLTLLHDQNGLVIGPYDDRPDLTIVVTNNDGGGIFSLLPYPSLANSFERVFGTPHGVDFQHVAAAVGCAYQLVETAEELRAALNGTGIRLIEVRTDRIAEAELQAAAVEAVERAVGRG